MAGIYIHIPFCKQACHYCDFHFSTSMKYKTEMVEALALEITMRKNEAVNEKIETIYFGGGTPSVLSNDEIIFLIEKVYQEYEVIENPEITLEANPDDLNPERIVELSKTPINRLSIGIQSFFEEDLKMMNRAHNAQEASNCLEAATKHFDNISIDLIYGIPGMSLEKWEQNIDKALSFGVPHISTYALTVEPRTALFRVIKEGKIEAPKDEVAQEHFTFLMNKLQEQEFIHYEISNFAKEGYFSQNNSSYWLGKKYIGIGPSAHSYDGQSRSWNIPNNIKYIKGIAANERDFEEEILSKQDRYNETVMTGLRTIWGISLETIQNNFGTEVSDYLQDRAQKFCDDGLLILENGILKTTSKGKFLSDGIASDLFLVE
ncbi:MAG: radical SAM family heme chaperone HemW [Flavobacterium sp.]